MKRTDFEKTPLSLALAGLFFGGFGNAQAESYNEWGFWAGSGAGDGEEDVGDGGAGGEERDMSGPLGDDIFDDFVAGIPGEEPGEEPANPFAFEDPPEGTWDVYASQSYAGCAECGSGDSGVAATGTLALTPSTVTEGFANGDGVVDLMLQDMDSEATDAVQAGESGGFGGSAFVGNGETGDQFVPFFTEGTEGFINTESAPGAVEDMADFFADGSVETAGDMIGEGGFFVGGQRTPSADLQALNTGDVQANYQGASFVTRHSVSIDVDFGAASWGGSFTAGNLGASAFQGSHDFNASGGFNAQGQGVSSSISGDATAGTVIFSFFGAEAQKLGGNFSVSGPPNVDGYDTVVVKDTFSAQRGGPVIPGGFGMVE